MYEGHNIEDKDQIYVKISNARQGLSFPLLIMGDFNEILSLEERKGQNTEIIGMRKFRNWINSLNLKNIPLNERIYTWKRGNSSE